jgi:squalene-hopene/tetraprenyl-beta-curcumene cyclase
VTAPDRDSPHDPSGLLVRALLDRRSASDHWEGRLSSSALSTATAALALEIAIRNGHPAGVRLRALVEAGSRWLIGHQNGDGGWGDTARSKSNISTTAIVWATLSTTGRDLPEAAASVNRSAEWLRRAAGGMTPVALRSAILKRYGQDRTFSVPILTVLALANKLGDDEIAGWRSVPQLPFELAALPHGWFQYVQLPVVSYALPALIAIGQVRHHFAPSRNLAARALRNRLRRRTHDLLRAMQPESGGYLEATPLTSFVVMSVAGMRQVSSPVVDAGVRFLIDSMREDGSWPIDTNLSTWVTTLSIGALADAGALPAEDAPAMRRWLIDQQSAREHPFTHAAPGAWAWTPLSGGVPDADDTSGALLALNRLGHPDAETIAAAARGVRWLLDVQNRDGGVPTFCRGWGALPFDRSTPEITSHALQAWSAWCSQLEASLQRRVRAAAARAIEFLGRNQRADGSWVPLWFGNEAAPGEDNPVYGTSRVLLGLQATLVADDPRVARNRAAAIAWLLGAQNADGGWGGSRGVGSSIEETGVAMAALCRSAVSPAAESEPLASGIARAARWLTDAVAAGAPPAASPIGLYFARLWYYEDIYPLVFALSGLAAARAVRPRPSPVERSHLMK